MAREDHDQTHVGNRCGFCGGPVDGPGEVCDNCKDKPNDKSVMSRRRFLSMGTVVAGGFIGVGYLGLAMKMLLPKSSANAVWQSVGKASDFQVDKYKLVVYTGDGYKDGVWVRKRKDGSFQAFDFHCAHMQCPVQWIPMPTNKQLAPGIFGCPCHGSEYTADGQHFKGPAPRGLYPHQIKVSGGQVQLGGQLEWNPNVKFGRPSFYEG